MNISASTIQPHRRLKKVEEDENAATLQLGREFQLTQINHHGEEEDLIALNLSEARLIIKEALIGHQETVAAVLQLLKSTGLHPFEVAQLGTLACDTADEAKTLIPSLTNKISDDDLERILKELSNLETLY
ncbi:DNA-directed RNA polymerase II subunit RPB4 [Nakaseomyces glabratus]|nr:DNA-directed RNA polymerase II subunit RPB4 [Nakaseomyces glabratus]KTB13235.1 DNA-directed RNA polymerase II subunit RPB4 [Nakaseomyces glabratus]